MAPVLDFRYSKPGDTLPARAHARRRRRSRSATRSRAIERLRAHAERRGLQRRRAQARDRPAPRADRGLVSNRASTRRSSSSARAASSPRTSPRSSRGTSTSRAASSAATSSRSSTSGSTSRTRTARRPTCGPGQILAARYTTPRTSTARCTSSREEGSGAYYRPDGEPMERQFLKAPLDYKRISSTFTNSRFHPILKIRRPHHGIDYAAPYGTSVWSVGNGDGDLQGLPGRLRQPREGPPHERLRLLLRAPLALRAAICASASAIHQKQVVGYVGSTGLSTGPHLCFRLAKEGAYVNPAKMHAASGRSDPALRPRPLRRDERRAHAPPSTRARWWSRTRRSSARLGRRRRTSPPARARPPAAGLCDAPVPWPRPPTPERSPIRRAVRSAARAPGARSARELAGARGEPNRAPRAADARRARAPRPVVADALAGFHERPRAGGAPQLAVALDGAASTTSTSARSSSTSAAAGTRRSSP